MQGLALRLVTLHVCHFIGLRFISSGWVVFEIRQRRRPPRLYLRFLEKDVEAFGRIWRQCAKAASFSQRAMMTGRSDHGVTQDIHFEPRTEPSQSGEDGIVSKCQAPADSI